MTIKQKIRIIESCSSVPQAANKLGVTRQTIYEWLDQEGLKIVRHTKLKVVKNE